MEWVYPKITVSLKFLLFYPIPKGDKRNFILVPVQKWETPEYFTPVASNSGRKICQQQAGKYHDVILNTLW
jgi:hypothetical protein